MNVRSPNDNNFADFKTLLSRFSVYPEIICVTEIRLKKNPVTNLRFGRISCDQCQFAICSWWCGNVLVYIIIDDVKVIGKRILQSQCSFEDIWVCTENKKTLKKAVITSIIVIPHLISTCLLNH